MKTSHSAGWVIGAAMLVAVAATPSTAHAQFFGHNAKGDFGMFAASQPPPGFYLTPLYYNYDGDRFRNASGESIALDNVDPALRSDLKANGYGLGAIYVTDLKLLGANVGFVLFPSLTDNSLEAPILGQSQSVSTGFGDLYFQPLNLGWHTERADYTAGIGIFAPTGTWAIDGKDNRGLGMWSFELFAGATVYFDKAKNWSLATAAFYETHTEKRDTNIRVGDILTLEGAFGRSFLGGGASIGIAYYAQWKLTNDRIGTLELPLLFDIDKHRVFGVGPELTLPIATGGKLRALLTARYLVETGARSTVEGQTLLIYAVVPLPSWSLDDSP